MEKKKVPLLLFSGGLDSSYMLQTYLEKGDVETLYVKGAQHPDKVTLELRARTRIIAELEKKTGNRVLKDRVVNLHDLFEGDMPDRAFVQPITWITGALQVSNGEKHAHLAIGYVSGDQVSSEIPFIHAAWENIQHFTKQNTIPVEFPLKVTTKLMILDNIWPEVVQHVWVCEMPERRGDRIDGVGSKKRPKSCEWCAACLTQAGTLAMWKQKHGEPYSHRFIARLRCNKLREEDALKRVLLKETIPPRENSR